MDTFSGRAGSVSDRSDFLRSLTLPARHPPVGAIAADLDAVEAVLARALYSDAPAVIRLVDHLRHFRGKRLRPMLLLLTARALGRVTPVHHTLAAVVELIHTA